MVHAGRGRHRTPENLILRRQLRSDGKSPAHINDEAVSVNLLRQTGDMLVEIQGQFEGRGLLDVSTYLPLIDRAAGHDEALRIYLPDGRRCALPEMSSLR